MPTYLHSGVPGRSYITNAAAHVGDYPLAKLDIKQFYPSSSFSAVLNFFISDMKCSVDVATLLTRLVTCNEHLPTGGCASQLLAFFAHREMFDEIFAEAEARAIVMTCYVDDLTFSGDALTGAFLFEVKRVIHANHLKYHKEKRYPANSPKLVTGVVVTGSKCSVPNRLHLAIYKDFELLMNSRDDEERRKCATRLFGRCNAAVQLDLSFEKRLALARHIASGLKGSE